MRIKFNEQNSTEQDPWRTSEGDPEGRVHQGEIKHRWRIFPLRRKKNKNLKLPALFFNSKQL